MAFSVPTPVPTKGVRRYAPASYRDYTAVKEKFKPSTELFCSKCIKNSLITDAYGFCKVCKDFLCSNCVKKHESTLLTLNHGVIVGNEMMERYQHAMRKDKKQGRSMSRNYLDMIGNGSASFEYDGPKTDRLDTRGDSPDDRDVDLIKEAKVRLGTDVMKCFICACVVYNNGKVVLADANNKCLKLFNKHFDNITIFNLKKEPWDMCKAINIDQDLYVTENRVRGIHQFKVGRDIQYVLTVKVDGECFGITSWKGGVAVSVKNEGIFSIKLLDQFGNTHRNIRDRFEGELQLTSPWYLSSIKKGQVLLISDAGSGTVSGIDVDGGISFRHKDTKQLRDPRNITSDEDDNIYVVEYETDTVHLLSPSGTDKGVILCSKDGLNNPCGMSYLERKLYIQAKMDSNYLQVYDLK
jgi:hypothetical protein